MVLCISRIAGVDDQPLPLTTHRKNYGISDFFSPKLWHFRLYGQKLWHIRRLPFFFWISYVVVYQPVLTTAQVLRCTLWSLALLL